MIREVVLVPYDMAVEFLLPYGSARPYGCQRFDSPRRRIQRRARCPHRAAFAAFRQFYFRPDEGIGPYL